MKCLTLCILLSYGCALYSQNSTPQVTTSLTVRHLHDGGWNSHVVELELTSDALLLSGPQQYATTSGVSSYCIFPARIPLERIDAVEARPDRLANGLKIFSNTSNSHTMLLHLEYRDDKGRKHGFDFIPADAQQSNNEWSGGDGGAVREFTATAKYTATLRVQQLSSALDPKSDIEATPTRNPITGEEIKPPDVKENVESAAGVGGPDKGLEAPVFYKAQMCWPTTCRMVTVWPVSPADPARLRVADDATKNLLVDIPREDISKINVRQQVVELKTPTPGQVTLTIPMPLIPPQAPKVYQMCLRVPSKGRKQINQCFISDLASCHLDVPCEEGSDGGRHVLELESRINRAIGIARKEVK